MTNKYIEYIDLQIAEQAIEKVASAQQIVQLNAPEQTFQQAHPLLVNAVAVPAAVAGSSVLADHIIGDAPKSLQKKMLKAFIPASTIGTVIGTSQAVKLEQERKRRGTN